ncbi:hypothetical protein [Ekhidna sp.]
MRTLRTIQISFVICLFLFSWGCKQDDTVLIDESVILEENGREKSLNPYSVEVMKEAVHLLSDNPQFDASGIEVEENYQYIRFDLPLAKPVPELERLVDLYNYPALNGPDTGEEVTSSEPQAYYAIIPVTATPPGSYQVLSSLYLPEVLETEEREQDLILLESKAYELAGWLNVEDTSENARLFGKWRPSGTIQGDLGNGEVFPIEGIKVEMAKAGSPKTQRTSYTDAEGKFVWGGARPLALVRYKFKTEKFVQTEALSGEYERAFTVKILNEVLIEPGFPKDGYVPSYQKNATRKKFNRTLDMGLTQFFLAADQYEFFKRSEGINLLKAPPFTIFDERTDFIEQGIFEIVTTHIAEGTETWATFHIGRALTFSEIKRNLTLNKDMRLAIANAISHQFTLFTLDEPFLLTGSFTESSVNHTQRVFLDLIDDDEKAHPKGYGSDKDQVSGFTLKELLESLKDVETFEDWRDELIANAENQEEAESIRLLMEEPAEGE